MSSAKPSQASVINMLDYGETKAKIPKIENYIDRVVVRLEDGQFKNHFRLLRGTCNSIIERFGNSKHFPKANHGGSIPLTAECHVLSFLWFAANKCCMRDVCDRFNMSLSTFDKVQSRVISFLIDIMPSIIKFPETDEAKLLVAQQFFEIAGFPNVIGCVDGSYITIRTPVHKIKSTYANRHDIPSVTLQGVCDAKNKFLDVYTWPPGKIHDSHIFALSFLSKNIYSATNNGQLHLLGDSAYSIREWLLTPYRNYGNLTPQQQKYNKKFCQTRVKIENTFGYLKGRFRELLNLEFHHLLKVSEFILSCCVLHNICLELNDITDETFDEHVEHEVIESVQDFQNHLRHLGEVKRDRICQQIS